MHNDLVKSKGKRCNEDMNAKYQQGGMAFGHGKIRMNVKDDRLSNLSDDLIHKILSFIGMRQAIGMSVLSCRWKFIWTSMPYLNFEDCHTSSHFSKCVSNVLSRRNNQIQVSSVNLVRWDSIMSDESRKAILDYAFSHNVQQLTATCHLDGCLCSLCSCRSLEHRTLSAAICEYSLSMAIPTFDLPSLTTLHIDHVTLSDSDKCTGLFSKCNNLRNLSLSRFKVMGTNVINIFHPSLSNLTLEYPNIWLKVFNVVAPQLKNLTIIHVHAKLLISAPRLTSLVMKGNYPLQISAQDFPSLEKVDLGPFCPGLEITRDLEADLGFNLSL